MFRSYLICELEKIKDSEDLIFRLNRGEDSAFSEAMLAVYFLQMGFEVRLEPVIETGRRNDLTVKVNSEWVNIEVKTPQKSELQSEMEKILDELFGIVNKLAISRDVYIFLTKEPTLEEQKTIVNKTLELATFQYQPVDCRVNDIAFIRTENLSFKPTFITPTAHFKTRNIYGVPLMSFATNLIDIFIQIL